MAPGQEPDEDIYIGKFRYLVKLSLKVLDEQIRKLKKNP